MLGVYVCLGNQRTSRFELRRTQVKIGSDEHNDLVLRDGAVKQHHCTLTLEDGAWTLSFAPPCEVRVNGAPVESPYPMIDRDQIALGAYIVVLELELRGEHAATQIVERDLIAAVGGGDEAAAMVYADWLEERGDRFRADFIRLQQVAFAEGTNASNQHVQAQRRRLRELASHIDIVWRQRVGRGEITGCDRTACPGCWSRLAPTADPRIRGCTACDRDVYYCRNRPESVTHCEAGHAAVIDIRDFGAPYRRR
jgi:uncharacterized protein (TIGR02996 family)